MTKAIQEAADKLTDLIAEHIAPVQGDDDTVTHGYNSFLADKQVAIQQQVQEVIGNVESWQERLKSEAEAAALAEEEAAAVHEEHAEAQAEV